MDTLKHIIIVGLFIYLGIAVFLYMSQRGLMYFPSQPVEHIGSDVIYKNDNEEIKVNTLNEGQQKALIYFGGNAEAVAYNAEIFADIFPKHTLYLVNYRGYGGSTGVPTEKAIYSDALYIFDHIQKNHKALTIMGRSLGSGVATFVASKRKISQLILVTPFDSIQNIAQQTFPIYPMSFLLKDKYNSAARATLIKTKVLMLIAENDTIIPKESSYKLASKFTKEQLSVKIIANSDHNTISSSHEYYQVLRAFLNE